MVAMEHKIFEFMQKLDAKIDAMDTKFDKRFDHIDTRLDKIDSRLGVIEHQVAKNAKWLHDEVTEIRADIKGTQNIKKLYSEEALKAVEAV